MVMIPKKNPGKETAAAPAAATTAAAPAPTQAPAPAAAAAPAPTQAPAPAPAATALATQGPRAVAVAGRPVNVVAEGFKDKLPLEWNTLHRLQATQGNFVDLEDNKKPLGGVMTLNLMTYQDNWQISPGTDDASDTQYVRYSDDGKFTKQGEDCNEYLAALKESGYTEAKMSQRVTLAGEVVDLPSAPHFIGKLIQIDLSSTSKNMFDRFQFQSALDVARNKKTVEEVGVLKLTAKPTSKGNFNWTQVEFDYGVIPG